MKQPVYVKETMIKYDIKTKRKATLGLGVVVAVAYAPWPAAREWIAASTPFRFFLICPLITVFMMKGIHTRSKRPKMTRQKCLIQTISRTRATQRLARSWRSTYCMHDGLMLRTP